MTDDYIKMISDVYEGWSNAQKKYIEDKNIEIGKEIERCKKIQEFLKDEKVREFADFIGFKEKSPREYLLLGNTLQDFLRSYMTHIEWPKEHLENDKYPIYCFFRSEEPIISRVTGKRLCDYTDQYWNLQKPGYSFGPSDKYPNGKNREIFRRKNVDNIIYAPEGESFGDMDTFYRVQAEFVEEALRTNQGEAKRLLLQKYGRRD